MIRSNSPTAAAAVARYESIQARLPRAHFPEHSMYREHLEDFAEDIDCFVLDGFGVLNIGDAPVPGAVERIRRLQALGKQLRVLTNGASLPGTRTLEKYLQWGFEFKLEEVISSRDALAREMASRGGQTWGFSALANSELASLAPDWVLLKDDPDEYERCDGFVLLSTGGWSYERQLILRAALSARPRPVLVGNPDLVAPHPGRLTREPGLFAHDLIDSGLAQPEFFGKPFDNAFALVRETLEGVDPRRIAMVGDTLHTDILGGAQCGWRTVLVTDHGLLKGQDVASAISRSGIRPDYIVPTT